MVTGFIRRKNRRDIRPGYPVPGFASFAVQHIGEMFSGILKRVKLIFELQELWWITRKPDEQTFTLVSDFTSALNDAKHSISSIDFGQSYRIWHDEMNAVSASLLEKISGFYNTKFLKKKSRIRLNVLIEDIKKQLEAYTRKEYFDRGINATSTYLSTNMKNVENFTMKYVNKRRDVTKYWNLTIERIRCGKIFSFFLSLPKIIYYFTREFLMSLMFTYHFFINRIWLQRRYDRKKLH
jgi:hypothetical protein